MILYFLLGLIAGGLSGVVGIGGGVFIVPALVYVFKMSQHMAQGTTLALLVPPIGILAAMRYYKDGYIDFKIATLICIGFFIGGYFGADLAVKLNDNVLRKIFGGYLLLVSIKMLFFSK